MDHPLIHGDSSDLRKRVIQLFQNSYRVLRAGNIIFVCGGNKPEDMRMRFREFCAENLDGFEIFFPEFAMEDYFSGDVPEPFDIADFESLVGELSHAIVIFPEAPGSFAETGYFSAVHDLASKTILAMDAGRQRSDSFISMGPAKKIASHSIFQPNIQINYENPNFADILERINRRPAARKKKVFHAEKFADLSKYELFCLIHKIVEILSIATIDDIVFLVRGMFRSQISLPKVRQLASILVGSKYICPIGDYGHYAVMGERPSLLEVRDGYVEDENKILIELAELYQRSDAEFLQIVESSRK